MLLNQSVVVNDLSVQTTMKSFNDRRLFYHEAYIFPLHRTLTTNENEKGQLKKSQKIYLGEKERVGKRKSAIHNSVARDAEKLGLEPIYDAKSRKKSYFDTVLDICNRVYEIATCDRRNVCVTIKSAM